MQPDEAELRRIQRKMDRSKRATNPKISMKMERLKKVDELGTTPTDTKMRRKRKELYRKIAVQRKMSHEKLANDILALGSDVRVETMRFQSLQKRTKENNS